MLSLGSSFQMVHGTLGRPRRPEGNGRDETMAKSPTQRSSLVLKWKMLGLFRRRVGREQAGSFSAPFKSALDRQGGALSDGGYCGCSRLEGLLFSSFFYFLFFLDLDVLVLFSQR